MKPSTWKRIILASATLTGPDSVSWHDDDELDSPTVTGSRQACADGVTVGVAVE